MELLRATLTPCLILRTGNSQKKALLDMGTTDYCPGGRGGIAREPHDDLSLALIEIGIGEFEHHSRA